MHITSLPGLGGAALAVGVFFTLILWALLRPDTDPKSADSQASLDLDAQNEKD